MTIAIDISPGIMYALMGTIVLVAAIVGICYCDATDRKSR